MKTRDQTRASIHKASPTVRPILVKKYKIIRNKVIASIRKDSLKFNEERISKANDEKELWNVVRDVKKPKKNSKRENGPDSRALRSISNEVLSVLSFSELSKQTFINNG